MTVLYHSLFNNRRQSLLLTACLLLLSFITVASDLIYSRWQQSSFFISESLLFSTFWFLFFPILKLHFKLAPPTPTLKAAVLMTVASTTTHLIFYPALVWALSACFYDHTFNYWQTFNFGLTEHSIKAVLIYSIPYPFAIFYKNKFPKSQPINEKEEPKVANYLSAMLVTETNNKKMLIAVKDILYFSANPPYVNIHHTSKKYLHTGTLKSLETQLAPEQFVRIHKSLLMNIQYVASYQSRLNGDYDLTLSDGSLLRLSRNYAAAFKTKFEERHRVGAK